MRRAHRQSRAARTPIVAVVLLAGALLVGAGGPSGALTGGWTVRMSSTGPVLASAISCPTASVCTAVGTGAEGGSAILRTVNGGLGWRHEPPPAGEGGLGQVSCATASFCLASGGGFHDVFVIATSDGGATWRQVGQTSGEVWLDSLVALSSTDWYEMVTSFGTPTLSRTTDGGKTWTSSTMPTPSSGESSTILGGLSCPTATTCYAVRPAGNTDGRLEVYKTTNGASTVQRVVDVAATSETSASVACWSASGCMVTGAGTGRQVLVTTNGGTSWATRQLPAASSVGVEVQCPSSASCFVLGTGAAGYVSYATSTQGTSWRSSTVDAAHGADASSVDSLSCPTTSACAATVFGGFGVYGTTDGTATWAPLHAPFGRPSLAQVACPNLRHCVAVGQGIALWSLDDGATWLAAAHSPPASAAIAAIACPVAALCLTGGSTYDAAMQSNLGVLFRSTNEGRTWNRVRLPATVPQVASISCPSATTCVALAFADTTPVAGTILRTTDGGVTWSTVALPSTLAGSVELTAVSCASSTTCLAVGPGDTGAVALVSTDAGSSWHAVTTPGFGDPEVLTCTSTTSCVTAGAGQDLGYDEELDSSVTTDGGVTWSTPAEYATGASAASISCVLATCQLLSAITNLGAPYPPLLDVSSNGGRSWTAVATPSEVETLSGLCRSPELGTLLVGTDAELGPVVLSRP